MTIDYRALLARVVTEVERDLEKAPEFLAGLSTLLDKAATDSAKVLPILEKLIPGISKTEPEVLAELKAIIDFLSSVGPTVLPVIEKVVVFLSALFSTKTGA